MGTILLVVIVLLFIILYAQQKKLKYLQLEPAFNEAGVKVSYCNGTIAISNQTFDVSQVSRIRMRSSSEYQFYVSDPAEHIIIEIDKSEKEKPEFEINLESSDRAQRFMQRLILALKMAGKPKQL